MLEIENELEKMSDAQRLTIIEFTTNLIRKNLNRKSPENKSSLEAAAELLYEDYLYDEELTAVTGAFDGEDFCGAWGRDLES